MKVLFRADASVEIGSGHVMRCLTLADLLRRNGAEVCFVCKDLPGAARELLTDSGMSSFWLPGQLPEGEAADLHALRSVLPQSTVFDWVVVDHYGLGKEWETDAKCLAKRVLAIDDLTNRSHDVDLLLNQNLFADAAAYQSLVPDETVLLLGPRFAMLRDEFSTTCVRDHPSRASRVLLNFGGSDPTGETVKSMLALQRLAFTEVTVIAGAANPKFEDIAYMASPQWRVYRHTNDMAKWMCWADVAIGATGSSAWERCALGLPTVGVAVAENQLLIGEALAKAGAIEYLGPSMSVTVDDLAQALDACCNNVILRRTMSMLGQELVDGRGAGRVALAMEEMV